MITTIDCDIPSYPFLNFQLSKVVDVPVFVKGSRRSKAISINSMNLFFISSMNNVSWRMMTCPGSFMI